MPSQTSARWRRSSWNIDIGQAAKRERCIALAPLAAIGQPPEPAITKPDHDETGNWRVVGDEPLRWRFWDGDYVYFSPFSGQTHFLDIVTGDVLRVIIDGPPDVAELRSMIADFLDVKNDERVAEATDDILSRLENAGLIEPVR